MTTTITLLLTFGLLATQENLPSKADPVALKGGELKVSLTLDDGALLNRADFMLVRMEDGVVAKMWTADGYVDGAFLFSGLVPGRYKLEAHDDPSGFQAIGYGDIVEGQQTELLLGLAPKAKFVVEGIVSRGGKGVSEANVKASLLVWPQPLSVVARTDGEGKFEMEMPQPGNWLFEIATSDWEASGRGWNTLSSYKYLRRELSGATHEVSFVLPKGCISGTLAGRDGQPIQGESVHLVSVNPSGVGSRTTSDSTGRYEFRGINAGEFWVSLGGPRVLDYGSKVFAFNCKKVVLEDDESRIAVDKFVPFFGAELECDCRDAIGRTSQDAWVYARSKGPEVGSWFVLGGIGQGGRVYSEGSGYVQGLPAGTLQISVRDQGLATATSAVIELEAGKRTKVTIPLEPASTLIVKAEDRTATPLFIGLEFLGVSYNDGLLLAGQEKEFEPLIRTNPVPVGSYIIRVVDALGRTVESKVTVTGESNQEVLVRF